VAVRLSLFMVLFRVCLPLCLTVCESYVCYAMGPVARSKSSFVGSLAREQANLV